MTYSVLKVPLNPNQPTLATLLENFQTDLHEISDKVGNGPMNK